MPEEFFKRPTNIFQKRVYEVVNKIPRGQISTYKKVAKLVGFPRAWRVIGNILNKNRNRRIPCHRVVRSDGRVGGYRYGKNRKIALLKREGVIIKRGRVAV